MKLTSIASALAVVSIPATGVLADRHAHPPADALGAMVARRDTAGFPTQHHNTHHAKRGSCPARLKKQKVLKPQEAAPSAPVTSEAAPKQEDQQPKQNQAVQQNNVDSNSGESKKEAPAAQKQEQQKPKQEEQKPKEQEQPKKEEPKQEQPAPKPAENRSSGGGGGYGLFGFWDQKCGASGATEEITKLTGPNGSQDFLNCGLYGAGWTPPSLKLSDLSVMPLDEALEDPNTPFGNCRQYVHLFDKYGAETGLPPILIASIAMQESSCRAEVTGGGGELGLMQITKEKCTAGIDCKDPDYNIKTGTYYLKSRLDAAGGNVLLALGGYNGWYEGLTVAKATAIKATCCGCQQDLAYFVKLLNGWLQNRPDSYSLGDFDRGC